MDNFIIQKEPDFEHLELESNENRLYSAIVKYNNVKYAMLGMLQNPPDEFKDVVFRHFAINRNEIMTNVDLWLEEAKTFDIHSTEDELDYLVMDHNPYSCNLFKSYSYYSLLLQARNELLLKLDELPSLDIQKKPFFQILLTEDMEKLGGYYKKMKEFMVFDTNLCEAGGYKHSLARHLPLVSIYNTYKARFIQEKEYLVQKEFKTSGNIFVLRDVERWDLMKLLISGKIDTNYSNGLFLFDVVCGEDYPSGPPKVIFLTTGRYRVNFHDRLKSNGEVLGLNWTPTTRLVDFFEQIQEIFNSPSNENLENPGLKHVTRFHTLNYGILDMLKFFPPEFKNVCLGHFELKRKEITETCES